MRVLIFLLLCVLFSNIAVAACPSNADSDSEFRDIIKRAFLDYMDNPFACKLTRAEVKDLIYFYFTTTNWADADCSRLGIFSGMGIDSIINQVLLWTASLSTTTTSSTTTSSTSTTSTSTTSSTTTSSTTTTSPTTSTTTSSTTTTTIAACPANCDASRCDSTNCRCPSGVGDCDSDAECQTGLICCRDDIIGTDIGPIYGCGSGYDICLSQATCNALAATTSTTTSSTTSSTTSTSTTSPTTSTSSTTTTTIITCLPNCDASHCDSSNCRCPSGEGDCDSDAQCQAGLICCRDEVIGVDVGPYYGCGSGYDICLSQAACNALIPTTSTTTSSTTTSSTTTSSTTSTSTTSSTTSTTTTIPFSYVGLQDPVVVPEYPEKDQVFQIHCPVNRNTYDCLQAYANDGSSQCSYSHWSGNNAVFNCPGMAPGNYTPTCKAVAGTSSNCVADETQSQYYVNGLILVVNGPTLGGGELGIQYYVYITTYPDDPDVYFGYAPSVPSDPNPIITFIMPSKTFLMEVEERRYNYEEIVYCGPYLVTLPSFGKYDLTYQINAYYQDSICDIVGASLVDLRNTPEHIVGTYEGYSHYSNWWDPTRYYPVCQITIDEAGGPLTEFYEGLTLTIKSCSGLPEDYEVYGEYVFENIAIDPGTKVQGNVSARQQWIFESTTELIPVEAYTIWIGKFEWGEEDPYPPEAYSFTVSSYIDDPPDLIKYCISPGREYDCYNYGYDTAEACCNAYPHWCYQCGGPEQPEPTTCLLSYAISSYQSYCQPYGYTEQQCCSYYPSLCTNSGCQCVMPEYEFSCQQMYGGVNALCCYNVPSWCSDCDTSAGFTQIRCICGYYDNYGMVCNPSSCDQSVTLTHHYSITGNVDPFIITKTFKQGHDEATIQTLTGPINDATSEITPAYICNQYLKDNYNKYYAHPDPNAPAWDENSWGFFRWAAISDIVQKPGYIICDYYYA